MDVIYHERIPGIFTTTGAEAYVDRAMRFDTAQMFKTVVKAHKADEGLQQHLERLEKYLSVLTWH